MASPSRDENKTAQFTRVFLRQTDPLPPPIDGNLRLVILSDTHGKHDQIPLPLPNGDVLFHLGDAADRGNISSMRSFVEWMKRNSFHKERIVIDGNHDRDVVGMEGWSKRDFMAEYEGVARVLRNEVIEVADGKLAVLGVTWDACRTENLTEAKYNVASWSESNGEEKKKVDFVLSHMPPHVEGGDGGWRYGSRVLSHFAEDIGPPLHCFGHIHYARGVRKSSDITLVNCATTWMQPVVIDYCPHSRRALMIHCPVREESLEDHLASHKFPREWLVADDGFDHNTDDE